jgi:hypothetical protein
MSCRPVSSQAVSCADFAEARVIGRSEKAADNTRATSCGLNRFLRWCQQIFGFLKRHDRTHIVSGSHIELGEIPMQEAIYYSPLTGHIRHTKVINPTGELITSGWPVTRAYRRECCQSALFLLAPIA